MNPYPQHWTLASASPRRLALLRQVGIEPEVMAADVDEIEAGHPAGELAILNAVAKADRIEPRMQGGILLAADTVVVVDGIPLGKPGNAAEAREMLARLSGRVHEVITGYSLRCSEHQLREDDSETTHVRMRTLQPWEIDQYIATGEPFDKAGGYGIQGAAAPFVDRIEGCYFNVVGLPLSAILAKVGEWSVDSTC